MPCAHKRDTQWHSITWKECALILQGIQRFHGAQDGRVHMHRAHAPSTYNAHATPHSTLQHTFKKHNTNHPCHPNNSTHCPQSTYHPHDTQAKHTPYIQCSQNTPTSSTQHACNAHTIYMHVTHIQYTTHLNMHVSFTQHTITPTHTLTHTRHTQCQSRAQNSASRIHAAHTLTPIFSINSNTHCVFPSCTRFYILT